MNRLLPIILVVVTVVLLGLGLSGVGTSSAATGIAQLNVVADDVRDGPGRPPGWPKGCTP